MIRYYLDSNVFRIIKPIHRTHDAELLNLLNRLKGKVLFCYSDGHLDDLKNSEPLLRNLDLELMGSYVEDNYLSRDPISKQSTSYLATPLEAFNGKNYALYDQLLSTGFNLDLIFKDLDEANPLTNSLKGLLKAYFSLPISAVGDVADTSNYDSVQKAWLDKVVPGYGPSMTLDALMNGATAYSSILLKDKREMASIRKYIRTYMTTDSYNFERWGMEFNERLRSSVNGRSFLEVIESMLVTDQKNDFYLKFLYAYSMLEFFGITNERSGKKRKDFTLHSLNTDATHAYFASFTDYFVTNDKGLQMKAHILYQLFKLTTKILSTKDLLNSQTILMNREETLDTLSASLRHDLDHSLQLFRKQNIGDNSVTETYKTESIYFNYFNRLQIMRTQNLDTYVLYCERDSHANYYMFREIGLLVKKINALLGMDDSLKGEYKMEEKGNDEKSLRIWTRKDITFELVTSVKSWGTFICLVFFLNKNK